MPAKYAQFAEMLETRVRRGDYALREMPTEQELANEIGVSRMTARRAMLELIERGVVARKPHGRVTVSPDLPDNRTLRLALLTPAHPSSQYQKWMHSTERVAYVAKAHLQTVNYAHWDDPVIGRSLANFDGVFIVATSEPMPARVRTMLSKAGNVVALDSDWSDMGVPSIRMMRAEFIHQLGDHLRRRLRRDLRHHRLRGGRLRGGRLRGGRLRGSRLRGSRRLRRRWRRLRARHPDGDRRQEDRDQGDRYSGSRGGGTWHREAPLASIGVRDHARR